MDNQPIEVPGGTITHHKGTGWLRLPIPSRWHRCTIDTSGFLRGGMGQLPTAIHRCRCGAHRAITEFDSGELPPWKDRNSRRRGAVYQYLPTV